MATLKEISEHTGFSPSTVSIVLGGNADPRKIPKQTQEIILNAARELQYTPNIAARRLRNQDYHNKLQIVLFWTDDFRASMMVRFLRGMKSEIMNGAKAYEIIIHPYKSNYLHEAATNKALSMFNAAVICNASTRDMEFLEDSSFHIPIVLYNRRSEKYCTVNVDNSKIGTIPAEVFISHGHKNAAIITSDPVFPEMGLRVESFLKTAQAGGITVVKVLKKDNSMRGGFMGGMELCKMKNLPSCLFCASDALALGALRAFAKCKIQIPEDIEIISVGNGDPEMEEYSQTSLSVVQLPMEEMARLCLSQVIDILNGQVKLPYSIDLPIVYKARESCGEYILHDTK
ncbi:MAG: LacI family DNA-binding transcriptional regulator [Dehalobacterium sp.]